MRLELFNYFFRYLSNKLVYLKEVRLTVSSDKVVLALELNEVNSEDLPWS